MKAVLDACVLYPTVLREIVLGVAGAGLITPVWSARLLEEWRRAAARNGGKADAVVAEGEIARAGAAFPGARVAPRPETEARLWLPDPADIHVLATAIDAGADTIITLNLRDFPARELAPVGVSAMHPDAALRALWLQSEAEVEAVVDDVHRAASQLSGTARARRALLKRAGLPRLGKAIG